MVASFRFSLMPATFSPLCPKPIPHSSSLAAGTAAWIVSPIVAVERCKNSTSLTCSVDATTWGYGVRGLSGSLYVRDRVRGEDDLIWSRSDDELDVMNLYAQLDRGGFRIRVGRQDTQSGLGFTSFARIRSTQLRKILRAFLG